MVMELGGVRSGWVCNGRDRSKRNRLCWGDLKGGVAYGECLGMSGRCLGISRRVGVGVQKLLLDKVSGISIFFFS